MDDDELAALIGAMRSVSANLIGFHELAESDPPPAPVDLISEAQSRALGYELACLVLRFGTLVGRK